MLADGGNGVVRNNSEGVDPFSALLVAASISGMPLAPGILAKAFPPGDRFPAVVATLPFLCSGDAPSGTELALLEKSAAFSSNVIGGNAGSNARAASTIRLVIGKRAALIGLPLSLSAAVRDTRSLVAFLATAERLARLQREGAAPK